MTDMGSSAAGGVGVTGGGVGAAGAAAGAGTGVAFLDAPACCASRAARAPLPSIESIVMGAWPATGVAAAGDGVGTACGVAAAAGGG
jgi:hypothetical protein